jgi:hypothetical protein
MAEKVKNKSACTKVSAGRKSKIETVNEKYLYKLGVYEERNLKMPIITLPRKSVKEINDEIVKIEINKEDLEQIKKQINWQVVEGAKGILKEKEIDPLEYQKNARKDWDRKWS